MLSYKYTGYLDCNKMPIFKLYFIFAFSSQLPCVLCISMNIKGRAPGHAQTCRVQMQGASVKIRQFF